MNYLINKSQLQKAILFESSSEKYIFDKMKDFVLERYPEINKLNIIIEKTTFNPKNNTIIHQSQDGEPFFKEFSDLNTFQDAKWEVNDKLRVIYELFGEKMFLGFVKNYFGVNLEYKGNKKYDWVFR